MKQAMQFQCCSTIGLPMSMYGPQGVSETATPKKHKWKKKLFKMLGVKKHPTMSMAWEGFTKGHSTLFLTYWMFGAAFTGFSCKVTDVSEIRIVKCKIKQLASPKEI